MSPRVLSFLALAVIAGCNTPTNPEPPDAARADGGPRDAAAPDTGVLPDAGRSDGGLDGGNVLDAGDDAANVDLDAGDSGTPPDAFDCVAPSGCYQCPPSTQEQFLDHCTAPGVTCQAFPVTTTRLPHLNADGSLPPLP
ncbi:MAG: hypothetical protein U0234_22080 [Sandaracinus sp.]